MGKLTVHGKTYEARAADKWLCGKCLEYNGAAPRSPCIAGLPALSPDKQQDCPGFNSIKADGPTK